VPRGLIIRDVDPLQLAVALVVAVVAIWVVAILLIWRSAPARTALIEAVRLLPDVLRLVARLARDPATPRSCRFALAGGSVMSGSAPTGPGRTTATRCSGGSSGADPIAIGQFLRRNPKRLPLRRVAPGTT
jgi:hypothetical protein